MSIRNLSAAAWVISLVLAFSNDHPFPKIVTVPLFFVLAITLTSIFLKAERA